MAIYSLLNTIPIKPMTTNGTKPTAIDPRTALHYIACYLQQIDRRVRFFSVEPLEDQLSDIEQHISKIAAAVTFNTNEYWMLREVDLVQTYLEDLLRDPETTFDSEEDIIAEAQMMAHRSIVKLRSMYHNAE